MVTDDDGAIDTKQARINAILARRAAGGWALDRVVAYWAHAGDYFSAAVVDASQIAEADAVLADVIRRLRGAKSKLPISRAAALEDVIAQLARV